MNLRERRHIGKSIYKYVMTGVLLFSSLGFVACKKNNQPTPEPEPTPEPQPEPGPSETEKELQKQIEELQKQIADLQALNEEIQALKEQIEAQKQEEINALSAQINQLNESLATLSNTIDSLSAQIEELQGDNAELNSTISNLQTQLAQAQSAYETLNAQKEQLEQQVADLQEQLDNILYYTVTFDTQKGTAVASQQVLANTLIDFTKVKTTRTGYTFVGWKYGDEYWDMEHDVVIGPVTLVAEWSVNSYTVTLDPNGGTVSPTSMVVTYDASYTLPKPTMTGYTFLAWYYGTKKMSTTGTKWNIAKDATLVADWALTNATITYVYNYDCDYPTTQSIKYNANYTLVTPERTGYTFLGWFDGDTEVTSGKWTFKDSITLEAHWSANTYVLNLDSGYSDPYDVSIVYDTVDPLPVCDDLSEDRPFAGWFIEKDGEKPIRITNELGEPLSGVWHLTEDANLVAKYFHAISTKEDWMKIADNNSTIYSLVNDLDLSDVEQIESFEGTLEGMGYAIIGMNWSADITNVGLFKTIKNATFEDISFRNDTIEFTGNLDSTYYIGLLASQSSATNTFRNVSYSDININVTLNNGSAVVGGLIGRAGNVVLENVTSGGTIRAESSGKAVNIGGFVGKGEAAITTTNCVNKADVIASALGGIDDVTHESFEGVSGGIVGLANIVNFTDTSNQGIVEGYSVKKDLSYAGGLIGKLTGSFEFVNSDNLGQVIATRYGGGLFGCMAISGTKQIENLYHSGTITDAGENGILGGLIGRAITSLFITGTYNAGNITSTNGYSGGLVGAADGSIVIEESYNKGTVKSLGGSAGGLLGNAVSAIISDCYNLGNIEGQYSAGGLLGYIDNYAGISYCYVGGHVGLTDTLQNGYVGGFAGSAGNLDISNSFVVAELKGVEGHINSVIGEHSCSAENVKSAASFVDMSDNALVETASYAQIVDASVLTDEYIESTLRFSSTKWNFNHPSDPYPTLLYFEEQE